MEIKGGGELDEMREDTEGDLEREKKRAGEEGVNSGKGRLEIGRWV